MLNSLLPTFTLNIQTRFPKFLLGNVNYFYKYSTSGPSKILMTGSPKFKPNAIKNRKCFIQCSVSKTGWNRLLMFHFPVEISVNYCGTHQDLSSE